MAMRPILVLALAACGGPKAPDRPVVTAPPIDAAVAVEQPVDAAAVAEVVPPDAPPPPPAKPFDIESLPVLAPVASSAKDTGPVITVYAADADGDALLRALEPKMSYVFPATQKRVTGKISAPKGFDAVATVAKLVGVDLTPVVPKGKGAPLIFDFVSGPFNDLVRVAGDAGAVNVVVAPGSWPALSVRFNKVPWDQGLGVMAARAGLTVQRDGQTVYLVPASTKLPPRNTKLAGPALDFDAAKATIGQIVTGIREVTKLELGSCAATRISQRAKKVSPADLARILEVASGEKLESADPCPSKPLTDERIDKVQLVAIVKSGAKRVAVFELDGATIIGTSDDKTHFSDIGDTYVEFVGGLVRQLRPAAATQGEDEEDEWLASLKRTSALVRRDQDWSALVETTKGPLAVDRRTRVTGIDQLVFAVGAEGLHVMRDSGKELRLMPLAPP